MVGRDGRADEGAGLENQYGSNLIVGSNPTLSAMNTGSLVDEWFLNEPIAGISNVVFW